MEESIGSDMPSFDERVDALSDYLKEFNAINDEFEQKQNKIFSGPLPFTIDQIKENYLNGLSIKLNDEMPFLGFSYDKGILNEGIEKYKDSMDKQFIHFNFPTLESYVDNFLNVYKGLPRVTPELEEQMISAAREKLLEKNSSISFCYEEYSKIRDGLSKKLKSSKRTLSKKLESFSARTRKKSLAVSVITYLLGSLFMLYGFFQYFINHNVSGVAIPMCIASVFWILGIIPSHKLRKFTPWREEKFALSIKEAIEKQKEEFISYMKDATKNIYTYMGTGFVCVDEVMFEYYHNMFYQPIKKQIEDEDKSLVAEYKALLEKAKDKYREIPGHLPLETADVINKLEKPEKETFFLLLRIAGNTDTVPDILLKCKELENQRKGRF